jgi:hypothetical protein
MVELRQGKPPVQREIDSSQSGTGKQRDYALWRIKSEVCDPIPWANAVGIVKKTSSLLNPNVKCPVTDFVPIKTNRYPIWKT